MTDEPTPERRALIQRAFERLSPFHQALFFMAANEKRSFPDIAKAFGISERQVERQLAKALTRFRRAIDEEENPLPRRRWLSFLSRRR